MTTMLSKKDAKELLKFCDSYSRLPTLLDISWRMRESDWLALLGHTWSICDNIGVHLDDLLHSPLGQRFGNGPIIEMMTAEDIETYNKLPEIVTVYRGCYLQNKWGFSWSTDPEIAKKFPALSRYQQNGQPLLVKAVADKKNGSSKKSVVEFRLGQFSKYMI